MTIVKSDKKKSQNYFGSIMKCRRNVNFEEIDSEPSTEKLMDFDYCEENLRSISNKILLRQCYERQFLIQLIFTE